MRIANSRSSGGFWQEHSLDRSEDRLNTLNTTEIFEFVKVNRADYPVATAFRLLDLSMSKFLHGWSVPSQPGGGSTPS